MAPVSIQGPSVLTERAGLLALLVLLALLALLLAGHSGLPSAGGTLTV
jgi:hypothetical protein